MCTEKNLIKAAKITDRNMEQMNKVQTAIHHMYHDVYSGTNSSHAA